MHKPVYNFVTIQPFALHNQRTCEHLHVNEDELSYFTILSIDSLESPLSVAQEGSQSSLAAISIYDPTGCTVDRFLSQLTLSLL